jgi:hypothetical protein
MSAGSAANRDLSRTKLAVMPRFREWRIGSGRIFIVPDASDAFYNPRDYICKTVPTFLMFVFGTPTTATTHNLVNANRGTLPRLDSKDDPADDKWASICL